MNVVFCPCCRAMLDIAVDIKTPAKPLATQSHPEQRRRPDGSLEPATMTDERAAAFSMPFGKYKGLTLAEIDRKDASYLNWLKDNVEPGSVARAVEHFISNRNR